MPLDPSVTRRVVHDTLKPVDTAIQFVELLLANPDLALKNPQIAKSAAASLGHVGKALQDMSTLAVCEQPEEQRWEMVDWTALVKDHAEALKRTIPFEAKIQGPDLKVRGDAALLKYALANLAWFVSHFSNQLRVLTLAPGRLQEDPSAELFYEIESAAPLPAEFERLLPSQPLSKKSNALNNNTALMLYTVRKIAELHGGALEARVKERAVTLGLKVPKVDSR